MGCTSSTPNMVATNPTDKIIHFSEDAKDHRHNDEIVNCTNDGNGTNEKVLPSCDTLDESIQLDRNNKSLIDTANVYVEKVSDLYANGHVIDGDNTLKEQNDSQVEEKLLSLEDVVDKAVGMYIADNTIEDAKIIPEGPSEQTKDRDQNTEKIEEMLVKTSEESNDEKKTTELMEEKLEEAISPSQSTSSRATRWEALADIAAELPPSLAVDPVTGQIYALSK